MSHILVVDDDLQIRELARNVLSDAGHKIVTVPSAEQAFEEVNSRIFDLILLDVNMSGESGVSFLKKIRAAKNATPIVVYSGMITTDDEKELRMAGANEIIRKGESVGKLTAQIEKVLKASGHLFQEPLKTSDRAILIVDDEHAIRMLLTSFFRSKNFRTVEAENGQKAIEAAQREKPLAVLLDIQMPVMDGLTTLQKLLQIYPKLGVVMVTAEQDDEKVHRAIDLGAYGYVIKPFDFVYLDLVVMSKLIIAGSY